MWLPLAKAIKRNILFCPTFPSFHSAGLEKLPPAKKREGRSLNIMNPTSLLSGESLCNFMLCGTLWSRMNLYFPGLCWSLDHSVSFQNSEGVGPSLPDFSSTLLTQYAGCQKCVADRRTRTTSLFAVPTTTLITQNWKKKLSDDGEILLLEPKDKTFSGICHVTWICDVLEAGAVCKPFWPTYWNRLREKPVEIHCK